MTKRRTAELHVLGPLEMVVAGEPVSLGGAKQRAVLAVLLLRSGEVVPLERLVDEVWGETPPPSAAHSVEAYVSRLRQILGGLGTTVIRRGAGYALLLGDATLDALEFERLAEEGWNAAAEGRFQDAARLAARALALWRGPALADVALASSGRAEAERLEELRLRTLELLFDAELALGKHDSIVGRVQALVGENPYRERFVSQLMLALYRGGRQADALDAYEQLRRRLDEDLGLQPSEELQQLSAQIVRQEPRLRRPRPSPADETSPAGAAVSRRTRRLSGLVLAGAAVAATMALSASGGAAIVEAETVVPTRIALLQSSGSDAVHADRVSLAFRTSAKAYGYDYDELMLSESGSRIEADERLRQSVESGRYALVLAADPATARAVRSLVPKNPARAFVFMDMSLRDVGLAGALNASAFRFRDEQSSQLAGYLSALIHPRLGARGARVDSVLVVVGPSSPRVERVVRGYVEGVRHAQRPIRVRVVRSRGTEDVTECERIANEQINASVDVVFAAAGRCGLGAIATARVRGVWSIGEQEYGAELTNGALAVTTKDWRLAIFRAIQSFEGGALPLGRDDALGLEDDYMVMIETGVSERVFSKIAGLCSEIRLAAATGA